MKLLLLLIVLIVVLHVFVLPWAVRYQVNRQHQMQVSRRRKLQPQPQLIHPHTSAESIAARR